MASPACEEKTDAGESKDSPAFLFAEKLLPTSVASRTFSPDELFRLTVAPYHQLSECGILSKEDRVGLLEGALVRRKLPRARAIITHAVARTYG